MFKFGGYTPQPITSAGLTGWGQNRNTGISQNPLDYSIGIPQVSVPGVSTPDTNYLLPTPGAAGPVGPASPVGLTPSNVTISPVTPGLSAGASDPNQPFSWGGALKNMFVGKEGGFNMDGLDTLGKMLGAAGSIYGAFKSYGIAQDSLDLNKKAFETNLKNSRQSYNTALEDRINSRAAVEGRGSKYVSDYLNKHSL